jgi:flagellar hook-associated protein 3 FlgL
MRVTGNSITEGLISQLNSLAARQARLQNQVSTGQRISAPEDDPAGMGRALELQTRTRQTSQYAGNVTTLQNRSSIVSNSLQALKKISDRAGELATQADGTQSSDSLKAMAVEVTQLIQQAVQLGNSRDGGQYIFSGTASNRAAFSATVDANGNVSAVAYQGNTDVMQTEIAQNMTLAVDSPGENSSGSGPRGVFADSRYGADLFNHLISLQNHLLSGDTQSIASGDRTALAQDEDNLIFHNASNGVMLSRLDAAASVLSSEKAALQQSLTNVAGADLTATLVQLSQTQNAYQVAAQSSATLMQLQQSLLSYLP